jgi:fermentation-respiration switch protein FrsA (DUF1100 family)
VYADVTAAYQFLTEQQHVPAQQIIAVGRSLGTAPTLELATKHMLGGVVIESPFLTAFRVRTVFPILPVDKFRNNAKVQHLIAPLLIIHGRQDKLIPIWHALKLYQLAKVPKKLYIVEDARHNNLYEVLGKEYWQQLQLFLAEFVARQ